MPMSFLKRLFKKKSPTTVLVVGMPGSIHTARWVNAVRHDGLRIVLFPSLVQNSIPEFQPYREVHCIDDIRSLNAGEIGIVNVAASDRLTETQFATKGVYPHAAPVTRTPPDRFPSPKALSRTITQLKPNLVHSLELQFAGYMVLECKQLMAPNFPPWIASSWGSDIFLYRKVREHRPELKKLFQSVDSLHSDCARDLEWAGNNGFDGFHFPQMPASAGAFSEDYPPLESLPPPSKRSSILIKGYHHWAGRGVHILLAIHLIAPHLRNFEIVITHAGPAMKKMAEQLRRHDGLNIRIDPFLPTHDDVISRLAQSRLAIGYGISDGISTTLLEAMMVGTFMIQANTCCGNEWISNGKTGLIAPPHDIASLANLILRAAKDDHLVDTAAPINRQTVEQRWCARTNGRRILDAYDHVMRSA